MGDDPTSSALIRFRLSHIDVVTKAAAPTSNFETRTSPFSPKGTRLGAVPTIRIFGATDRGQRVVAHVHGAFPYVFIEYKGKLDPDSINSYSLRLGKALNSALAVSFPNRFKSSNSPPPQYVAFVVPAKGIPFYGYSVGYKTYLKIYAVNPRHTKKMSDVLRSGALMNQTKFEVYEDHIAFLLQFMLDLGLYGCGWVYVKECLFRNPLPDHISLPSDTYAPPSHILGPFTSRLYDSLTVPPNLLHPTSGAAPPKNSHCPLEIDLHVGSILNRLVTPERTLHHDFHSPVDNPNIFVGGEKVKLVDSVRELWEDERKRREARGEKGPTDSQQDDEDKRDWDTRDPAVSIWQSEDDLRDRLATIADSDLNAWRSKHAGLNTEGKPRKEPELEKWVEEEMRGRGVKKGWLAMIKTTYEQVDAVFHERWEKDEREEYVFAAWAIKGLGPRAGAGAAASKPSVRGKERERSETADVEGDFDVTILQKPSPARSQLLTGLPHNSDNSDLEPDDLANYFDDEDEDASSMPRPTQQQSRRRLDREEKITREGIDGEVSDEIEDFEEEEVEERRSSEEADWGRETKRSKIDSTAEKARSKSLSRPPNPSPSPSPPPTPPPRPIYDARLATTKYNPFASPTKGVRVRFANGTLPEPVLPSDSEDENEPNKDMLNPETGHQNGDFDAPTYTSISGSGSPAEPRPLLDPQNESAVHDSFSDLPSDTFDDEYNPTPTMIEMDPGPDRIPRQLRSFVDGMDEESSSGEGEDFVMKGKEPQESVHNSPTKFDESGTATTQEDGSGDDRVDATPQATPGPTPLSNTSTSQPLPTPTPLSNGSSTSQPVPGFTPLSTDSSNPSAPLQQRASDYPLSKTSFVYAPLPPTSADLLSTIESYSRPQVVYTQAHYSNPKDVPSRSMEYGGRSFTVPGVGIGWVKEFGHWGEAERKKKEKESVRGRGRGRGGKWEWTERPLAWKEAVEWVENEQSSDGVQATYAAAAPQIEGPTQAPKFIPVKGAQSHHEKQHMSLLTMELQVSTRTRGTIELRPDPKADAITALFYCFQSENEDIIPNGRSDDRLVGCLAVGDETFAKRLGKTPYKLEVVEDENTLINRWIDMVQKEFDPEIVAGYEVHYSSWGYLIERARLCYDWDIVNDLGRMISNCTGSFGTKDTDRWGFNETSTLNFTGRHVISIWRVLKADNKLLQNSFEHVVINILRRRTPHFSFETLTQWYNSKSQQQLARVFAYWINRVEMDVELLEESEDISKNCEFARIYGVDFRSVRLRGSQFKVEAVMFRIAKPESFLLLSVTRQEVGRQNAAECQPLIMEPKSGFYTSPLIVLDFQSLYPSVMIAYNYCYSTCMGRIGTYKGTTKLGTTSYDPPPGLLSLMKDDLIISPNGMAFVPATVRKSLLAKMLAELLDSRVMVKSGMKGAGGNKALLRLLNGRQLALKLLANVTYGYTSATFSGRMPCVEIADAIVQTGRETLERAIETVRSNAAWGAEVVYGDTDSLFIYLPGKSKADAFKIGQEIADKVTSQNPRPIKLKFEKVYLPSCLLAKKRYVGWCYETEKVKEPAFDAKGIETVRRDGFMAQQKLMESALKTLFRTADLSQVKAYVQRQWSKLEAGDVSPQDFTFAKAVKLGSYSDKRPPPPGAAVASRLMDRDPRAEISYGERVPYLLFEAEPETRQVDRALSPDEFLADSRLRLDAPHYIGAMIKVLNRIFNHVGVDVQNWYTEMPKVKRLRASATTATGKKALLDEHFTSSRCIACDGPDGNGSLCKKCLAAPDKVLYSVKAREREATTRQLAVHKICASCEGTPQIENITCDSLDCPTLYSRVRSRTEMQSVTRLVEEVEKLLL